MNKYLLSFSVILLLNVSLMAQDKTEFKFGDIKPVDFDSNLNLGKVGADTSLGAIILADVGSSSFVGNDKGWFSLIYTHFRRVKILNKKGYSLASIEIPLYVDQDGDRKEKIQDLKASTYTISGKIISDTKLAKEAIFSDKQDRNHVLNKFTMPNIKDGCIIEYYYTIHSDFLFNLQPWTFQLDYPSLWSEYSINIPPFFEYELISKEYIPFDINTKSIKKASYSVNESLEGYGLETRRYSVTSNNLVERWVIKDIPAFKKEPYVYSFRNLVTKLEFQMSGIQFPNSPHKDMMGTWNTFSKDLLKDEDFGQDLKPRNYWVKYDFDSKVFDTMQRIEKAKIVFEWVRDHFKSTDDHGIYLSKPLKDIFKNRTGQVQDINLLLTALLLHEDLEAKPVLLSTRSHGFISEQYPLVTRFNYVICLVNINGNQYLLDATNPSLEFNQLPEYCYNGQGRIIDETSKPVLLSPDSLMESTLTSVELLIDIKKPGEWLGNYNTKLGYFKSLRIKDDLQNSSVENYGKKLKESLLGTFTLDSIHIINKKNEPITLDYSFKITLDKNDNHIYLNPIMIEKYIENPFKSAERKYPIEMPYPIDKVYLLQVDIPKGYILDELPIDTRVILNENQGLFEYFIIQEKSKILLRTRIRLNKAKFPPEDYKPLRDFFDLIIKKQTEQIVFKKQ